MKRNLLLYALVFSVLINIFQMVNSSRILAREEEEVKKTIATLKIARDSLKTQNQQNYFSLEGNPDAQEYFAQYDLEKLKLKVSDDLMELNSTNKGNKYVPYEALNGKKFIIDKIKILNHRWLIANFSDGTAWGEVLIKYFHNEKAPTEFETIETLLYQHTVK